MVVFAEVGIVVVIVVFLS